MSLNKIILVGRVTKDPELRYTPNGKAVAQFGLAVNRPRSGQGEEETDFFDIVVWQKTAEIAAKFATKGTLVAIDGRMQIRTYEKDGQKRRAYEVVANDLRLLGGRSEGGGGSRSQGSPEGFQASREPAYSGSYAADSGAADLGVDDIPF